MTQGLLDKKGAREAVDNYYREIRDFPLLTAEAERELAMACQAGDENAIRTMVTSNLRLVVSVAREYEDRGVPLLDLIQEGSIGLLIAAKRFDYLRDVRFSTYATKWIRKRITQYILGHSGMIRVPQHTAEKMKKLLYVRGELQKELQREPAVEEIAASCGMPTEKAATLLSLSPNVCSLEAPTQQGDESTIALFMEDEQSAQPYESLVRQELKNLLEGLLDKLKPRQREILRLRFGMEDGVCYSLDEVRQRMDISKERVRQIEQQAIAKLQKLSEGLGLEEFLI